MDDTILIVALLLACLGFAAFFAYIIRKTKMGNSHEEESSPTSAPHLVEEPELEEKSRPAKKSTDHRTVDEIYAEANGMWICAYCETMNKYPFDWVSRKKPVSEPTVTPASAATGLRGDLLNRTKKNAVHSADTSNRLSCIACGKQQ